MMWILRDQSILSVPTGGEEEAKPTPLLFPVNPPFAIDPHWALVEQDRTGAGAWMSSRSLRWRTAMWGRGVRSLNARACSSLPCHLPGRSV